MAASTLTLARSVRSASRYTAKPYASAIDPGGRSHAFTMVDKRAASDRHGGMDIDSKGLGHAALQEIRKLSPTIVPQPMADTVPLQTASNSFLPRDLASEWAIRSAIAAVMIPGSPAIAVHAISPSRSAGIEYSASLCANSRVSPEAKPSWRSTTRSRKPRSISSAAATRSASRRSVSHSFPSSPGTPRYREAAICCATTLISVIA